MNVIPENISADQLNKSCEGSMIDFLGIKFTEVTSNSLTATMPVNEKTKQPMGFLHGGASMVLAETLGSMAANLVVNRDEFICVGLEINGNHLMGVMEGEISAKTTPLHIGKTTQVWEIKITNTLHELVNVSRHTVAVIRKK